MIFPIYQMMNFNEKPPTLYSIMNSIVNYNREEPIKIPELAKYARSTIFNFNYELDNSINKEDFECMILNHFIKRRIGTETFTEFQINLCVKLNSIMPTYNKLFNIISNNKGFGETIEKSGTNDRNTNTNSILNSTNNSNTNGENITDNRNSELPQSELENIQNASYVSNYTYNKDSSNSANTSESESSSNSNTNDNTEYRESTNRTNILEIYTQLSQNTLSVYNMIFKELNSLFYSLV